jgi:hypothetical protein
MAHGRAEQTPRDQAGVVLQEFADQRKDLQKDFGG